MKLHGFYKNSDLLGGFTKNQYIGRNCLKGGLRQYVDLRGGRGLIKSRGGMFLRGKVDTSMHTMKLATTLNCDINLLVPMSLLLISNIKCYLATDWLLIITFDVART